MKMQLKGVLSSFGGRWIAATLVILTTACGRGGTLGGPVAIKADDPYGGAPSWEELAFTTYEGIVDQPITLTNGRWQGEPHVEDGASRPSVGLIDHGLLVGDLDGDGANETAALLWESSGGSGNRLYLAVMTRRNGDIENLDTVLVGDRVQIRTGKIEDGRILLSIVRAGPNDAACCPTEKAVVGWALSEGALTRNTDEVLGTLSLADLEGPEWVLIELDRDQALPQDVEISLVFEDGKVSGLSACNSYFAGVDEPAPGELRFNGMGATRMACEEQVMDVERRYLSALAGARRYSFQVGWLVLGCETDDGPMTLTFAPKPRG
jgi:heat shock protein HslJ